MSPVYNFDGHKEWLRVFRERYGSVADAYRGFSRAEVARMRRQRLQSPDVTRRDASDTVPTHGNNRGACLDARSGNARSIG